MIPVSRVIDKYPNIANFFPKKWFESELKKGDEDIHLLAKQLTFKEKDECSLVYLEHIERCLDELKNEIRGHENHFRGLVHKQRYHGILAELEIGLMYKNMGFEFEFEPPVQNGFSDIKITNAKTEIFTEVSIRKGPSFKEKEKIGNNCTVSEFEIRLPQKFKSKIIEKSSQLSNIHPGIFTIVIDPSSIPEIDSIMSGFGFGRLLGKHIQFGLVLRFQSMFIKLCFLICLLIHEFPDKQGTYFGIDALDPSKIVKERVSGLLIYCNYTTMNEKNNCRYRKEDTFLCVNPLADIQLPTSVIQKFEIYGTEKYDLIYTNYKKSNKCFIDSIGNPN